MAFTVDNVRDGAFEVQQTVPGTTDLGQCALIWLELQEVNATSSGTTMNFGGVVDPEGVQTATQYSVYVNTAAKTIWWKESAGTGNTGWIQYQ